MDDERRLRIDLAACYRLIALFGWDDLVFTHVSVRLPGQDAFLINPYGRLFDEITASSLVKVDAHGNKISESPHPVNPAGFVIHSAVHEARPETGCVMHLHTEAGMAVAMLAGGLRPVSQHAMRFYDRIAYHDFEGLALDADEKTRLVADLGRHDAMILRNHGLLTCGATVAAAYVRMFYLEKSAVAQLKAMATGDTITVPPPEICEKSARQFEADNVPIGTREWPSLLRRLDREDPGYRS